MAVRNSLSNIAKKYNLVNKYVVFQINSRSFHTSHSFCTNYFDIERFGDEEFLKDIEKSILHRKCAGNLEKVTSLYKDLKKCSLKSKQYKEIKSDLVKEARLLCNTTHPSVPIGDEAMAKVVQEVSGTKEIDVKNLKTAQEIATKSGNLVTGRDTSFYNGSRSYHLVSDLAYLQDALTQYTIDYLLQKDFQLISVPDLVPMNDVESSGFQVSGERTQVYKVPPGNVCLSGTGEMPIASYLANKNFKTTDLPLRLMTASRCFRAETSDIERERGLYRVHHFTKVEMFAVTDRHSSNDMLQEILDHQIHLFTSLGLGFRVLDMPTNELGLSAHRKFDVETWLPAKKFWAELSSASNCTDYQSARLNTTYFDSEGFIKFCHTINGTACAVPRILISIIENFQQEDGSFNVPECLHAYLPNKTFNEEKSY